MDGQPTFWGRLLALIEGEVAADTLEAYRRAGGAVYDLLRQAEDRRLDLKLRGVDPWSVEPATRAELLCAWNAFALQTLGDQLLDADYRAAPATVGYVPAVTAAQILAFYGQVESWLCRAHEARSNPGYRLDVSMPADLPPWSEVEPCPRAHLEARLAATGSLRSHAEAALVTFQEVPTPPGRLPAVQRLRQLLAEATAKADYAERLWAQEVPVELHERIERSAKEAIERYYDLGQLLAMPELVDRYGQGAAARAVATVRAPAARPAPGEPGFDPWCLTDPASREQWKRDPEAQEAIDALWAYDPDPRRTLAIQGEIEAALARGDVAYATDRSGAPSGPYYCCPWAPVYVVKRPVTIGGRRLRTLQEFTFDVSAEEVAEGGAFKREILVGTFQPTRDVDYCNPLAGGHRDESRRAPGHR